jgi:hypothetical protein
MPLTLPTGFNLINGVFELAFIKPGSDPQTGTLAQTRFVLN